MSKRKDKPESDQSQETSAPATTQAATGSSYATMLATATRLATAVRTGTPLPTHGVAVKQAATDSRAASFEVGTRYQMTDGIMVFEWVPTVGVNSDSNKATTPLNMAVKALYSEIRHANSGARNYEASDLGIYLMAADSLYNVYYDMLRVYGALRTFTPNNRYYPRSLVTALGYDFDDLTRNQANFLFYMQNFAAKLKEFAIPSVMRLFTRHMRYNSVIYTDGDTDKSQLYLFRQKVFFSYEKVDQVKGLTPLTVPATGGDVSATTFHDGKQTTFADISGFADRLLNAFMNSDDVALISGDIIKAFGDASVNTLPLADLNYTTPIVKDDGMLTTINNLTIVPIDLSTCIIKDDQNGNLICNIGRPGTQDNKPITLWDDHDTPLDKLQDQEEGVISSYNMCYAPGTNNILNFVSNAPTSEEVANAVALHCVYHVDVATAPSASKVIYNKNFVGNRITIDSVGTELVVQGKVYRFAARDLPTGDSGTYLDQWDSGAQGEIGAGLASSPVPLIVIPFTSDVPMWAVPYKDPNPDKVNIPTATYALSVVLALAQFDWHPFISITSQAAIYAKPYGLEASTDMGPIFANSEYIGDYQNMVPISDEVLTQIQTAWLYVSLFE